MNEKDLPVAGETDQAEAGSTGLRMEVQGDATRDARIEERLSRIEKRLATLEERMGIEPQERGPGLIEPDEDPRRSSRGT